MCRTLQVCVHGFQLHTLNVYSSSTLSAFYIAWLSDVRFFARVYNYDPCRSLSRRRDRYTSTKWKNSVAEFHQNTRLNLTTSNTCTEYTKLCSYCPIDSCQLYNHHFLTQSCLASLILSHTIDLCACIIKRCALK